MTDEVLEGLDLSGQRVLITGASAGLGVETARALAAKGASVVLAGARYRKRRSRTRAEVFAAAEAAGGTVELCEVQLDSLASVRAATEEMKAKGIPLTAIVANAGIMACPEGRTVDGFETQIGTKPHRALRPREPARTAGGNGWPAGAHRHPFLCGPPQQRRRPRRPELREEPVRAVGRLRAFEDGEHPLRGGVGPAVSRPAAFAPPQCTRAASSPSSADISPRSCWRRWVSGGVARLTDAASRKVPAGAADERVGRIPWRTGHLVGGRLLRRLQRRRGERRCGVIDGRAFIRGRRRACEGAVGADRRVGRRKTFLKKGREPASWRRRRRCRRVPEAGSHPR